MKKIIILALAILLTGQLTGWTEPSTNAITGELRALVEKINVKLSAGMTAEADLTNELKGFDAILARHPGDQSDELASVVFMKAMLYVQVFNNALRAQEAFKQLIRDFPKSKFKPDADSAIVQLERPAATQRIQESLAIGSTFPAFDEKDINGHPLSLANLKGKVVLIDFWATWCVPCRMSLPGVIAAYAKHHSQGFEVVGVSLDAERAKLEEFIKRQDGMTWPQFFDEDVAKQALATGDRNLLYQNKLGAKYGVNGIPTTYLLDREGKIIGMNLHGEELENAVSAALAKK